MNVLEVNLSGELPLWPDLAAIHEAGDLIEANGNMRVGVIPGGLVSGKASVAFAFRLPDGKTVVFETTLALFLSAAAAIRVRFGEA